MQYNKLHIKAMA